MTKINKVEELAAGAQPAATTHTRRSPAPSSSKRPQTSRISHDHRKEDTMCPKKKKQNTPKPNGWSGVFSPTYNGETVRFDTKKFVEFVGMTGQGELQHAYEVLFKATGMDGYGGMNPGQRLRAYDKYVPVFIRAYAMMCETMLAAIKERGRVVDNSLDRANKRWEQDEDETLITLVADQDETLGNIAIAMGRTPAAIQSRLTYLIGIKRVSEEIAGRFVGTLNGEQVEGYINGELRKQATNDAH